MVICLIQQRAQYSELEIGIGTVHGVAQGGLERRAGTNLSLTGFINESLLYAFPPTPSFNVSAPELSADPCLALCSLRTMSPALADQERDPGDSRCPPRQGGKCEPSESAGGKARPATGPQGCGEGRGAATSTSCISIPGGLLKAHEWYGRPRGLSCCKAEGSGRIGSIQALRFGAQAQKEDTYGW